MKREITYDEKADTFDVHLTIPKTMRGTYTYGEGEWTAPAVCVWLNPRLEEYALCQTQYLDYKDSLQSTQPIFYFDNREEAVAFAEKYHLMIEEARDYDE